VLSAVSLDIATTDELHQPADTDTSCLLKLSKEAFESLPIYQIRR